MRKEFWTAFGHYIKPVPSEGGEKTNWLNYKTGIKHVLFRLDAGNNSASVAIEITHADEEIQQLYFEQFLQQKSILQSSLKEEWIWKMHMIDEDGKVISKIFKEIYSISIFNKADWPALISFFKPRIIALDEFRPLQDMDLKCCIKYYRISYLSINTKGSCKKQRQQRQIFLYVLMSIH